MFWSLNALKVTLCLLIEFKVPRKSYTEIPGEEWKRLFVVFTALIFL